MELSDKKAINAATLQVTFNKSLDSKTVFADQAAKDAGTIKSGLVSLGTTDLNSAGYFTELSSDGKTLTFTATSKATALFTNADKDYVINVADEKLKTTGGEFIPKFSKLVTVKDSVAPKLVKTTQVNAKKVALQFSEPIDGNVSHTTVTATLADGTPVAITGSVDAKDSTVFNLDLTALATGKTASVKIIGLTDYATNLTETNPLTLSVTAGQQDDVAPEVSTITQTGAKEFTVKFSEELQNTTTAIAGLTTLTNQVAGATAVTSVKQDSTDKTKYVFTTDKVLDSVTTVSFGTGLTDLSGTATTAAITKVVNFSKDSVAPTVSSYQVVKDSTTGKEYLELTFDKNVNLAVATATATTGTSYVKDYITTAFTNSAAAVSYKDVDVSKKVVRVALPDLIGTANDKEGAVYTTKLALANITSEAGTPVTSTTATFTRGTDTAAANNAKLNVTSIAKSATDNNKIDVTFDKAVDGATATNPANYSVQGAVVESVALGAVNAGNGSQTATLTLKKDSNANTGYLNVSVANVKNYDKTRTVEAITKAVNLTENVRPTVTAATLTGTTTITLTFSEAVNTAATDFDVYVGGTKLTTGVTTAVVTGNKTVAITIPAVTAAQIASGIVVKPSDTNTTVDTNTVGNALNFTSINVAQ